MQKPFSIIQLRHHLQALYADAISFSKLVEILNETAADPTRHQWVSFAEAQPKNGENIIVQYHTLEMANKTYYDDLADFYKTHCLRWLNQKSSPC